MRCCGWSGSVISCREGGNGTGTLVHPAPGTRGDEREFLVIRSGRRITLDVALAVWLFDVVLVIDLGPRYLDGEDLREVQLRAMTGIGSGGYNKHCQLGADNESP